MLVTQTIDKEKYEAAVRKHLRSAPFTEWQHKLKRGDKLPRGKFFRGKKAGKPVFIMDEAHLLNESYAVMNSAARQAGLRLDMSQMLATADNKV